MNKVIAFAGNPNCGKTTLFNAYTGARLKTANWPGVTVEKKEGTVEYRGKEISLTDIPGIYALSDYTEDERIARRYITDGDADAFINVVDASALERNLYLTMQLAELGKPMVIALNMMDIVRERGMKIDIQKLSEILGVPVIPVCARRKEGLSALLHAAAEDARAGNPKAVNYGMETEKKISEISDILRVRYPEIKNVRWYALKILEKDREVTDKYPINMKNTADKSYESEIINKKYDYIEKIIAAVLVNKEQKSAATDTADKLFTHPIFGLPVFLVIMAVVFFLTFSVGGWLKGYFESALKITENAVGAFLDGVSAKLWLKSLILDGIISGVGGILTFLPNIFMLFLALAFLEDSGYMPRAAYVADAFMKRLGLSGKAFIPMILGFGCSVPAVMAARSLEDRGDRLKTIFITPFMSCSARLPIYILFSQMFFGKYAAVAAYSMYLLGMAAACAAAKIYGVFTKNDEQSVLLIELPEYKMPNLRSVMLFVWDKVRDYMTKAGTTIFTASIVLWAALNFGPYGYTGDMSQSFGAEIGRRLVFVMKPAGLGYWQIIAALISGLAAKEVVVSALSVLYGAEALSSAEGAARLMHILTASGFTAANAYSMMIFCLMYVPCIATLAVVRRESGSMLRMLCTAAFQLVFAWCCCVIFYQLSRIL